MPRELKDLADALDLEDGDLPRSEGRSGYDEQAFKLATQALLARQFLYADKHGDMAHFALIKSHRVYFEKLADALGMEFVFRPDRNMVGVMPGEYSTVRGRARLADTFVLLAVRTVYQKAISQGEVEPGGVVRTRTNEIKALFEEYTERDDLEKLGDLKGFLSTLGSRGLLEVGEFDDERDAEVRIRPAILEVCGERWIERFEHWLAFKEGEGSPLAWAQDRQEDGAPPSSGTHAAAEGEGE